MIEWFKQKILYNHRLFGGMSDADFLNFKKDMKNSLDNSKLDVYAREEIKDLKAVSTFTLLTRDDEEYTRAKKAFDRKAFKLFLELSKEAMENHRIRVIDRRWSFCLGLIGRYIFMIIIGFILGLLF